MTDTLLLAEAQRAVLSALASDEADEARLYARRMRNTAAAVRLWEQPGGEGAEHFLTIELAGTCRIGQTRGATRMSTALRLTTTFADTLALLEQGRLFVHTAEILLSATQHCTEQVQAAVQRRVLDALVDLGPGDARALVERTTLEVEAELDPELTRERRDRAHRGRNVWVRQDPDGMGAAGGSMTAEQLQRWTLDFEELVRAQKIADRDAGVQRTQDQRRADVFAELPSRQLGLIQALQQGNLDELRAAAAERVAAHSTPTDIDAAPAREPEPSHCEGSQPKGPQPSQPESCEPEPEPARPGSSDISDRVGSSQSAIPAEPPDEADVAELPQDPGDWWDPAESTDPPEVRDRLAGISVHQLCVELLRLPVRNPQVVNVHIAMSTILDLDHRAGYLEGRGPVSAEQVRLMVPVSGLRQIFVHGDSGVPLEVDDQVLPAEPDPQAARDRLLTLLRPRTIAQTVEPRHDPSARLSRAVQVRDVRCVGIGCERKAGDCDGDHEIPYPDGPTAFWNISSKSRRCHRAKHAGWGVHRHDDGTVTWTSPLGHSYQRPGVWSAHPALPQDLALPPVRNVVRDDHDPNLVDPNAERPLLPPPNKPAARTDLTGADPAQPSDDAGPQGWSDEPPF